jgi:hypothetical protein
MTRNYQGLEGYLLPTMSSVECRVSVFNEAGRLGLTYSKVLETPIELAMPVHHSHVPARHIVPESPSTH